MMPYRASQHAAEPHPLRLTLRGAHLKPPLVLRQPRDPAVVLDQLLHERRGLGVGEQLPQRAWELLQPTGRTEGRKAAEELSELSGRHPRTHRAQC